jgi:hypothetical protein
MMPNLISLKIKTTDIYLNGNKWKKILGNYLKNLKIISLSNFLIEKRSTKNWINLYKTSFWIEKHR